MGVTAAIVTAVAAVVGTAVSAVSAISSGQQQKKAAKSLEAANLASYNANKESYEYQAAAAKKNQEVEEANALATETAYAYEEKKARIKAAQTLGTQVTTYGKSGVLMEGSPLDVMAETAELEEQDILATKYNYTVQAARYRSQAEYYQMEEEQYTKMAAYPYNSKYTADYTTSSYLKAGSSLLTGGAKLATSLTSSKSTYDPNIPGSGWGTS